MHTFLFIFSLLSLSLTLCVSARTCSFDYECGNMPYAYCDGGESDCAYTLDGFAVNATEAQGGSIYYAQFCRTQGMFGQYIFEKVPLYGGVPVNVHALPYNTGPSNPIKIVGIVDDYLYYENSKKVPGVAIVSVDVTDPNSIDQFLYTNNVPQGPISLDPHSPTPATYMCNYNPWYTAGGLTIEKYAVLPTEGFVASAGVLYETADFTQCGVVARYSDVDLFFTLESSTTSYLYRGTILCSNCTLPLPFYTVQEKVIDLDVSGGFAFYGTASGLFRVNLDGTGNVKISKDGEKAVAVAVVNGRVIYNNGVDIKSVDFQGNNILLLSYNRIGTCTCRSGFTGANCDVCDGQVQWSLEASPRPTCVPLGAGGVPTSCNSDYQCGSLPYTQCVASQCTCRSAFTGVHCDVCDAPRQVTWDAYNMPWCT